MTAAENKNAQQPRMEKKEMAFAYHPVHSIEAMLRHYATYFFPVCPKCPFCIFSAPLSLIDEKNRQNGQMAKWKRSCKTLKLQNSTLVFRA